MKSSEPIACELIRFLEKRKKECRHLSTWAYDNGASDDEMYRESAIEEGKVRAFLEVLKWLDDHDIELVRSEK